ncbi:hypothetical protein H0H93_000637 [Arthromyces matolae]|nr:hypothetical protein H0H93_000637 [Arthromyces matolae]
MVKVGADIRAYQKQSGLIDERTKRKNHDEGTVTNLLPVPRRNPGINRSKLIKSRSGWRTAMAQWNEKERANSDDEEDEPITAPQRRRAKWLPRSLELLFSGRKETDIDEQMRRIQRKTAYTEEARLMELVAAEEADEDRIPDDGELEGSGDEYDG